MSSTTQHKAQVGLEAASAKQHSSVMTAFRQLNTGYNSVFKADRLTIGLVVPIESYPHSPVPTLKDHVQRVQLAESLGFKAVWLRDVPFNVPTFGDAGQTFDPFVYLGLLAGQTSSIALGVASLILPLRHPAHVAKAAASVDALSAGRLILGVASGDRAEEYPALNMDHTERGERFRHSYDYIRQMAHDTPVFDNALGSLTGNMDMLPKPVVGSLPLLVTGNAQQSPEWIAQHADGWMTYPRDVTSQARVVDEWQQRLKFYDRPAQPVMQPLYVDLVADPAAPAQPIHLGFRSGLNALRDYLLRLQDISINHVSLNLRFNQADTHETLHRLADELLIDFA